MISFAKNGSNLLRTLVVKLAMILGSDLKTWDKISVKKRKKVVDLIEASLPN